MLNKTIFGMFKDTVHKFGYRHAFGRRVKGEYQYISYSDAMKKVQNLRSGLYSLGLRKGDRVAILSENRVEWALCDLSAQSMGLVTVPIYPTLTSTQIQYILKDSASKALFISDEKQFEKIWSFARSILTLQHIIMIDDNHVPDAHSLNMLMNTEPTDAKNEELLDKITDTIHPEDTATLIYTSGTTGDPKGAALSHQALLHTAIGALQIINLNENDLFLSFLPLSHIVERVAGYYLPLYIGALIIYSEGVFTIADELRKVRPTVFLCVPRLYESMQEKFIEYVSRLPKKRQKLLNKAMDIGMDYMRRKQIDHSISPILWLKHFLADKIILSKIRRTLVGGRTHFFVSGGAPLNPHTGEFFHGLGIEVIEGYGLTEFPVISVNHPGGVKFGTVGPPLPGIEIRIEEDGEILAKGPSMMQGYYGKADETSRVIDDQGWFHTGDIGEFTSEGFLRITDRKKDIIVLANGKNVAPQPIESRLKESHWISEIVLLGDKQNAIYAIVVPVFDRLKHWAAEQHLPQQNLSELVTQKEVKRLYKEELDRLSDNLADFERVKRFVIMDHPFSIEGGELTPTLKVKRKVIVQKYANVIEQLTR
jgi:long-chain acyl-CoA synthetase